MANVPYTIKNFLTAGGSLVGVHGFLILVQFQLLKMYVNFFYLA